MKTTKIAMILATMLAALPGSLQATSESWSGGLKLMAFQAPVKAEDPHFMISPFVEKVWLKNVERLGGANIVFGGDLCYSYVAKNDKGEPKEEGLTDLSYSYTLQGMLGCDFFGNKKARTWWQNCIPTFSVKPNISVANWFRTISWGVGGSAKWRLPGVFLFEIEYGNQYSIMNGPADARNYLKLSVGGNALSLLY